ncbi:membrane protein insertase YidC [Solibacillus sp. FSL W7-1464]|uniref:membrane protein insertase YidC n=1 Tax=Solibacillus sp. FSL W7-1464 TaxID=2921706 RepID=UPI0030F85C41
MKKYILLLGSVLLLGGCSEYNQPISSESEGIWNEWIVWPIVKFIQFLAEFTGSYAGGIILVTVIVKICILPLTLKQIKSSRAMQALQPQLQALQKKYSSKDAETQQQYQQEMMKLMQRTGANPIAGCLPVLIQMPILIGLYHGISRMNVTPMYELGSIFGVPLATSSIIFAMVAGGMQYLVLKTGPVLNTNPQMVIMQYILPVMIMIFGFMAPTAITLYWIVNSFISILQNIYIYKILYGKDEITALVNENK